MPVMPRTTNNVEMVGSREEGTDAGTEEEAWRLCENNIDGWSSSSKALASKFHYRPIESSTACHGAPKESETTGMHSASSRISATNQKPIEIPCRLQLTSLRGMDGARNCHRCPKGRGSITVSEVYYFTYPLRPFELLYIITVVVLQVALCCIAYHLIGSYWISSLKLYHTSYVLIICIPHPNWVVLIVWLVLAVHWNKNELLKTTDNSSSIEWFSHM